MGKKFGWAVKFSFHLSTATFWGTFLRRKKNSFFLVSRFWAKNNRIFGKNFPHAGQNSILRLQWSVLMKIEFFGMTNFLIILVYWPEKISTSWQKKLLKGCQTEIYVPRGMFWCFFGKNLCFFTLCPFWAKTYRTFVKRTSAGLKKLNFTCPEKRSVEFHVGTCKFLPLPDFEQKTIRLPAQMSSTLVKTAFNISRGMFRGFFEKTTFRFTTFALEANILTKFRRKFFGKIVKLQRVHGNFLRRHISFEKMITFFSIFRLWLIKLRTFGKQTLSRVVKTDLHVHRVIFRWLFIVKSFLFIVFGLFLLKFFKFLAEIYRQACQKCNQGVQWNILRKNLFSHFHRKNLGLLRSRFWRVCQKCISRVHGNVVRNVLPKKKQNFEIKYKFFLFVFGLPDKFF